jgi:natural product biosynthesis luciferase-like monooxygenase protein
MTQLSVYCFGASRGAPVSQYEDLMRLAERADELGFHAIWLPERHFQAFGNLFPNPVVLAAAVAARTTRIAIRAGSVVLPLHHPIRVCEDWAVVDNLSNGRVGISFASGWHRDDFVLAVDASHEERRAVVVDRAQEVARLWRDGTFAIAPEGTTEPVTLQPRPVQRELPIWVTSGGTLETFLNAGANGWGVLTSLIGEPPEELGAKIARYRESWVGADGGGPHVTVLMHAFASEDDAGARAVAREPLRRYLRTYLAQFGAAGGADQEAEAERRVDFALERYLRSSSLIGSLETCRSRLRELEAIGADEVACLVDFGIEIDDVLDSLERIARLREGTA